MTRLIGGLFLILPAIFFCVGIGLAWNQHRKITTYQEVNAKILSSRVESHRSHGRHGASTSYSPRIEYEYEVGGNAYTCSEVTPISHSAGRGWANEIVARFRPGQVCTAYHDPDDPGSAFLLREYAFLPYFFMLFPMVFIAVGLSLWLSGGRERWRAPVAQADGWYAVPLGTGMADWRRAAAIILMVWLLVGIVGAGHYFSVAGPTYETFGIVTTAVYFAVSLVPLAVFLYYWLLGRRMEDARLWIGAGRLACGDSVAVHVEQAVYAPVTLEEYRIGLVCAETTRVRSGGKTRYNTRICHESWVTAIEGQEAAAGDVVAADATVLIPPDGPATTPPDRTDYPRHAWRLEVHARIPGNPDYHGRFPIRVEEAQ